MLQIRNLTLTHRKDLRVLLEDFSFTLNPGDRAVIIGEEGDGKSTLLKWIYDPELVDAYAEAEGERIVSGERLGYLPQELSERDKALTVRRFFSGSPAFREASPSLLARLTSELSLPDGFCRRDQTMGSLSGGEKVKAQMLRLLLEEPTVLLLDEPSNDIDIATLEWLERFIARAQQAVLFISHDEVLIERTANVVVHLEQLRRKTVSRWTVMRVPYAEYASMREAGMRNQEALALTQRREQKIREEKFRRIQQKVEHDLAGVSRQNPHAGRLLKKKMKAVKSLEHRYEREKQDMAEMPDTEDAMFIRFGEENSAVPAGKTVIDLSLDRLEGPGGDRSLARDVRLFVRGSEKVCITGPNGAGKSTLLRLIAAQLAERPDLRTEYMPQDYADTLDGSLTPVEFLCPGGGKEETTKVRSFLGSMKYTADEMEHRCSDLSGGQRAKLLLCRLCLSDANVLILDEPTRNFSPLSGPVIRRAMREFPGAVISVSHDRKYVAEVCDTVYELTPDGLVRTGKPEL